MSITCDRALRVSRYLTTALAIAFAVLSTSVDAVDLPTATHGFESWAAVVGKAMSFGGKNKDQTLQALESFQKTVQSKMQKQVSQCTSPSQMSFCPVHSAADRAIASK